MNFLLRRISMAVVVIALLFLSVGLFLPTRRHLERSITINAPASIIFAQVNNYKNFEHWSPWANIDPAGTVRYEGAETGLGSTMIWNSKHPKVGNGSQRIIVSEPNKRILVALKFDGFKGEITAGWKFEEKNAEETLVTWSNDSHNKGGIFARYMDLIIAPQIGKDYEQGLKNLKIYAEHVYKKQQAAPKTATAKPSTPKKK